MNTAAELPWIEAGYSVFALQGPEALKVEQLARQVGISKSSFYHHFADLPVLIEVLLRYHQQRAQAMAVKAATCRSFNPDYVRIMVAHRLDLLFQRQLRMRRHELEYQECFNKAHHLVMEVVMPLWAESMGLPGQLPAAREMLAVVTDVFYQRLTNDNLTDEWVVDLLNEIEVFIRNAMKSQGAGPGTRARQS